MSAPSVIVSGMIAATPRQGGATWAVLQYLLGLRGMGCTVWFVEAVTEVEPPRAAVAYLRDVMAGIGFEDRWALLPASGKPVGVSRARLKAVARETDVLLNVSGMLEDEEILEAIPVRAYLDLDPAFVQLWHAVEGVDMRFGAHTHFVSVADSIGARDSPIPDCGREWIPTLPPVFLDEWPRAGTIERRALTTVAHWRSYGSIHHGGLHFGQKAHSLRPLIDLPKQIDVPVELALGIHPDERDDLKALDEHGWKLLNPQEVVGTPSQYRAFVQRSWAELGIAKLGYVVSDSGWFSDRSACYLASGRPVVAQDTGFGRRMPTGDGLLPFTDAAGVVAAVTELKRSYDRHSRAARELACALLESKRVLGSLLERLSR